MTKEHLRQMYYKNQLDVVHIFKYVLALMIGFFVMQFMSQDKSYWILVTIVVVMSAQASIGLQVSKSIMRILGTLSGAILGILLMALPPDHGYRVILIIAAAIFFCKLSLKEGSVSYVGSLGMVTFFYIGFSSQVYSNVAWIRLMDIVLGIVISLIVSRFVFPLNSRRAFIFAAIKSMQSIRQFVQVIFIELKDRGDDPDLITLDVNISKGIAKQRALIAATHYDSFRYSQMKGYLLRMIRLIRAVHYYILFIDTALSELALEMPDETVQIKLRLQGYMSALMGNLDVFDVPKVINDGDQSLESLRQESQDFADFLATLPMVQQSSRQIQVVLFTLNRITRSLSRLVEVWNVVNKPS